MRQYELWFIAANISNESKIELIKKDQVNNNLINSCLTSVHMHNRCVLIRIAGIISLRRSGYG